MWDVATGCYTVYTSLHGNSSLSSFEKVWVLFLWGKNVQEECVVLYGRAVQSLFTFEEQCVYWPKNFQC